MMHEAFSEAVSPVPDVVPPARTGASAPAPRLVRLRLLRGCNRYHARTVQTAVVDLGRWARRSTAGLGPAFVDGFLARFDAPVRFVHRPALDPELAQRLRSPAGAPMAAALLAAVRALDTAALDAMNVFDRVGFAVTDEGDDGTVVRLIWETHAPSLSRRAATLAVEGLAGLLVETAPLAASEAFARALAAFRDAARARALPVTAAIVKQAAADRGLLQEAVRGRVTIGEGKHQKHFVSSLMEGTSFVAVRLALDKRASSRRFQELGLPVPAQAAVDSIEEAQTAAERLGWPAVIKPAKGNQGRGVTAAIASVADIAVAFERADREGSGVIVESFIRGSEYRLLVVGSRFIAASCRIPPSVIGDGVRTVRDLVAALNSDPRRDGLRGRRIAIDEALVHHVNAQGHGIDEVPEAGRTISLRTTSNLVLGGMTVDVTDKVHPDNRRLAERAAHAIGLDIAGIDFVTEDVTRSHHEVGGAIIEINARPGLEVHALTFEGPSRAVGEAVVAFAFPTDADATIPKLLVAGGRGTVAVARRTERRLRQRGLASGLVLHDAAYAAGVPVDAEAGRMHRAIRTLLRDPTLEALVCATSLRAAVRRGLTLDHCDAAALLPRRASDEDLDTFASGVELVAAANRGAFVVRADDGETLAALAGVRPERLILVAVTADDTRAARHVADGGTAVRKTWHDGVPGMALVQAGETVATAPLADDARGRTVQAPLFAWGLAHALAARLPPP